MNNVNNPANETKSQSTKLSKSSFVKLNQNTFGGNTLSKLNEKHNNSKFKKKPSEEKIKENLNVNSISHNENGSISLSNEYNKEILDEGLTCEIILNKIYNEVVIQIKILNVVLFGLYIIIIAYFLLKFL